METAETAMETDGDGSGSTSPSGRVPEQGLLSPEIHRQWRRSCGTLLEILPIVLGFSVRGLLIGEGGSSGVDQGLLTSGGCGQGLGHACSWCGQPLAPLRLLFGPRPSSGKIGVSCVAQK
jgi:hypothetical protein